MDIGVVVRPEAETRELPAMDMGFVVRRTLFCFFGVLVFWLSGRRLQELGVLAGPRFTPTATAPRHGGTPSAASGPPNTTPTPAASSSSPSWPSLTLPVQAPSSTETAPRHNVFVAIMSRPAAGTRRAIMRRVWAAWPRVGWNITVKFPLCEKGLTAEELAILQQERWEHGDIEMQADCEDNDYMKLTGKTLQTLRLYTERYSAEHDFFMKTDTDAYIPWPRYTAKLEAAHGAPLYFDYFRTVPGLQYATGGCGYGATRDLARASLAQASPKTHWAEDWSFGVWVQKAENEANMQATKVKFKCINTVPPCMEHPEEFQVLHHVNPEVVECLARIELAEGRPGQLQCCGGHTGVLRRFAVWSKILVPCEFIFGGCCLVGLANLLARRRRAQGGYGKGGCATAHDATRDLARASLPQASPNTHGAEV